MVIGPGPIGLVTVVAAKSFGANPVILVGHQCEKRLALGKEMGADYLIKIDQNTPREEVAKESA